MRTRVGYCGGALQNPNYHNLEGHTETIEMDFDPTKITYTQLLEIFWTTHNPCRESFSQQYASIIFYHGEEQKKAALETRDRVAKAQGQVYTEIVPAPKFWIAEDYHQKYMLRNTRQLMNEFRAFYPKDADFVNSTAAARANGYVAGHGKRTVLEAELPSLGLSAEAGELLLGQLKGE